MPDMLSPQTRSSVVQEIAAIAREKYVFSEMGEKIAVFLLARLERGDYDGFSDPHEFALALKSDLRTVSSDKHWDVLYDARQATVGFGDLQAENNEAETARWVEQSRYHNFGFEKVERLPGNIGYIDLRGFALPEYAGETAVAAMGFVANSDALIFDLRQNGGGESEMLQLLISYLFTPELKHLNTIYSRPTDEYWQFWTLPHVPGKRMPDIPVYVLTSQATFSGAEEFAYDLKHMGRAVLVGETTGGGGHMVDLAMVQGNFQVLFPFARAIHPITKSSWEGTGVEPHIAVPQEEALQTAHLHALNVLIEGCQSQGNKKDLLWDLETVRSLYDPPIELPETVLKRYTGQYGQRTFALQARVLTYTSPQSTVSKLIPLAEGRFRLNDDSLRFEFVLDDKGVACAVTIAYREDRPTITVDRTVDKVK